MVEAERNEYDYWLDHRYVWGHACRPDQDRRHERDARARRHAGDSVAASCIAHARMDRTTFAGARRDSRKLDGRQRRRRLQRRVRVRHQRRRIVRSDAALGWRGDPDLEHTDVAERGGIGVVSARGRIELDREHAQVAERGDRHLRARCH